MSASIVRLSALTLAVVLASGCGASEPRAPSRAEADLVASRQRTTRALLEAFSISDQGARGRLAAAGLNEQPLYLVPAPLAEVLRLASTPGLDAQSCSNVLRNGLAEKSAALVRARCGASIEDLSARVLAEPRPARADVVSRACRLGTPPGEDAARVDPWAVLASALVRSVLSPSGALDPAEARIADELGTLCLGSP